MHEATGHSDNRPFNRIKPIQFFDPPLSAALQTHAYVHTQSFRASAKVYPHNASPPPLRLSFWRMYLCVSDIILVHDWLINVAKRPLHSPH